MDIQAELNRQKLMAQLQQLPRPSEEQIAEKMGLLTELGIAEPPPTYQRPWIFGVSSLSVKQYAELICLYEQHAQLFEEIFRQGFIVFTTDNETLLTKAKMLKERFGIEPIDTRLVGHPWGNA